MSFAISIIGCIFGCRISNAPNYEYQAQHHFCIGEPEKERCANRRERTHPYACHAFVRTAKALHINHEVDRCKWFTPQEARENIRPNSLAAEFLNAYLDEVGNKPMEM